MGRHHSRIVDNLADPSGAYGLAPPRKREEKGRGFNVVLEVLLCAAVFCALLTFGAGLIASRHIDIESWLHAAKAQAMVDQTLDVLAAYSFETVSEMNGSSLHEYNAADLGDYRVDLAITPSTSGMLRIQATLFDTRTSRAVSRFVTWRGRS